MDSVVIFTGISKPEKNLIQTRTYKAYLSNDMQESIMNALKDQVENLDDWDVKMHVEIEIKLYKNDTKNTGI